MRFYPPSQKTTGLSELCGDSAPVRARGPWNSMWLPPKGELTGERFPHRQASSPLDSSIGRCLCPRDYRIHKSFGHIFEEHYGFFWIYNYNKRPLISLMFIWFTGGFSQLNPFYKNLALWLVIILMMFMLTVCFHPVNTVWNSTVSIFPWSIKKAQ